MIGWSIRFRMSLELSFADMKKPSTPHHTAMLSNRKRTESGHFVHTVIKHIVEIDICEQRRCAAALRRACLHLHSLPVLQHARVQPSLGEPHLASVCNPVLDELH